VAALEGSLGRPAETRLQSEAVYQIEFSPHNNARRCFSRLLHLERAVVVTKHLTVLRIDSIVWLGVERSYYGKTRSLSLSWALF
jgi:hypothetical protein